MDQSTLEMITVFGLCFCAYMIGRSVTAKKQEETISDTIVYLCEKGFIKHYTNKNDDLEIVELDQDIPEDNT